MPRVLPPQPRVRTPSSAVSPGWAQAAGTTSFSARKTSQSLASFNQLRPSWAAAGSVSSANARPAPNKLEVNALAVRVMMALQLGSRSLALPSG
jgi:hypothetical protein